MFHNTINVTSAHGGEQLWGIPGEISVELAASLLPGYGPNDMIKELRQIVGNDVQFDFSAYEPSPAQPDIGFFKTLVDILHEAEPDGVTLPMLLLSPTDGRTFSRLGIQTYGVLPMKLPADFSFIDTIRAG